MIKYVSNLINSMKLKKTITTITNKMVAPENRIRAEVFKLIQPISTPTFEDEKKITKTKVGDFVLILEDEVWIYNESDTYAGQYSKAAYSSVFVRENPLLFQKI